MRISNFCEFVNESSLSGNINKSVDIKPTPVAVKKPRAVKIGNCYKNAYETCLSNQGATYVEGTVELPLGNGKTITVGHAWNSLDGVYFDVTAESDPASWYGINYKEILELSLEEVLDIVLARKKYGPFSKVLLALREPTFDELRNMMKK